MSHATTSHAAWLELVGGILQGGPGRREFPHAEVAGLLLASFDAACCSLNVLDGTWIDHVVDVWPHGYLPRQPPPGVLVGAATHPLIRWYAVTGSRDAQVLGRVPRDVAPARMAAEWSAFARPFGITHQLALPLRQGGGVQAYVVSRPGDDFHDADVELANLVRPVLAALVGQEQVLEDVTEWQCDRARGNGLTERELAVLRLLGAGLTAEAIARRLHTSPRTVHKHLEHLYRKLGVRDRLMAVQRAREAGLLATCGQDRGPRRAAGGAPVLPTPRRADRPTVAPARGR